MRDVSRPPKLALQGISKSFGHFRAVDDVSLTVSSGAICGLIGPNGAGKSTLFAVATGLLQPQGGTVFFDGVNITHRSSMGRAGMGLARTFQVPREFAHLSVHQNLTVARPGKSGDRMIAEILRPGRVRAEEAELAAEADAHIRFLGLERVRDEGAGRLSGGQKKLLELGRALMLKPSLILLDEPFAGVNPVLIGTICEKLLELRATGLSFLIVEHNLPALSSIADTMFVMDRGRLIGEGTPESVLADRTVRSAYLGERTAAC